MTTEYLVTETVFVDQGRLEFTIPDIDVRIICTNVKRTSGKGAGYVKNWKMLSNDLMKILSTWYNTDYMRNRGWEKKHLRSELQSHGVYINEDPMNARMSELLGLGLVVMRTKTKPEYRLVVDSVSTVLDNNGRLHIES